MVPSIGCMNVRSSKVRGRLSVPLPVVAAKMTKTKLAVREPAEWDHIPCVAKEQRAAPISSIRIPRHLHRMHTTHVSEQKLYASRAATATSGNDPRFDTGVARG